MTNIVPLLQHRKVLRVKKVEITGDWFFYTVLMHKEEFEMFEEQCTTALGSGVSINGLPDSREQIPVHVTMRIENIHAYASKVY